MRFRAISSTMPSRWSVIACLGLALLAGCPKPSAIPPKPPVEQLTANGKHFATERIYEGECAMVGSRGGCHTITFRPDGTYRDFLFDAGIEGTYEISGTDVTLTSTDTTLPPEKLTLSADRAQLGALTLETSDARL